MPTLRMGPAEWAMLLLLSVLWGGSFFFVQIIVTELPPLMLVACRVGLAALALIAGGLALVDGRLLRRAARRSRA